MMDLAFSFELILFGNLSVSNLSIRLSLSIEITHSYDTAISLQNYLTLMTNTLKQFFTVQLLSETFLRSLSTQLKWFHKAESPSYRSFTLHATGTGTATGKTWVSKLRYVLYILQRDRDRIQLFSIISIPVPVPVPVPCNVYEPLL